MPVLRERKVWKRDRQPRASDRLDRLTPEEETHVRAAMNVLRIRYGGMDGVAKAMGASKLAVQTAMSKGRRPGAGLALKAAKLAGVPVEDVLSGAFPKAGSCLMCGRDR
jgi:hypothetical protein